MSGTTLGVTFSGVFNGDASDLFLSVHLPEGIDTKPEILRAYIAYAERRLIYDLAVCPRPWTFACVQFKVTRK